MFFGKIQLLMVQQRYFEYKFKKLAPSLVGEESNSISPYDRNTSLHLHNILLYYLFILLYKIAL